MSNNYPENLITLKGKNYSIPKWLLNVTSHLEQKGYRKYKQNLKHEDYSYCKSFSKNYQICIYFYDWRKFGDERIGILFECRILNTDDRIDLSYSKDISIEEFEIIAQKFYNNISNFI